MPHYTYILRCSDNTLYAGYTNDIEKRIAVHNSGKGAKYTRGRIPIELVYIEKYDTESEARKRENEVKKMRKKEKELLVSKSLNIPLDEESSRISTSSGKNTESRQ